MTLQEACNVLHVDAGNNDDFIKTLLEAIPPYIETATGLAEANQDNEPLVKTVSGFLLIEWYYADHADDIALNRTISSLLKAIAVRARSNAE